MWKLIYFYLRWIRWHKSPISIKEINSCNIVWQGRYCKYEIWYKRKIKVVFRVGWGWIIIVNLRIVECRRARVQLKATCKASCPRAQPKTVPLQWQPNHKRLQCSNTTITRINGSCPSTSAATSKTNCRYCWPSTTQSTKSGRSTKLQPTPASYKAYTTTFAPTFILNKSSSMKTTALLSITTRSKILSDANSIKNSSNTLSTYRIGKTRRISPKRLISPTNKNKKR